ncbi:MAG: hypothetical protein IJB43_01955 [Clostridia bacterium]|nr:hypothetical protein [Clostridia bacterium]
MKTIKMTILSAIVTALTFLLLSCSGEAGGEITTAEPELTLGELPDYSDAHAEDAPYIVFSSDLEPISEERFEKVRQALYNMLYQNDIDFQYEQFKDSDLDNAALLQYASLYKSILMNPNNQPYDDYFTLICNYVGRYYGTVNGCEIVCLASFIDKHTVCELGGVKIESKNPIYLFACKDKEMIPLEEAYEKEWLAPTDILLIAKRNRDFNEWWEENGTQDLSARTYVKYIPELEDLSDEVIAEIYDYLYSDIREESYASMVSYLQSTYGERISSEKIEAHAAFNAEIQERSAEYSFFRYPNSHSMGWRYYGIIGGYVILAEVEPTDNVKVYKLGEYEIKFSNGAQMWVYSAEKGMIEIDEAFKQGLLTEADVSIIQARYTAYEEYLRKK